MQHEFGKNFKKHLEENHTEKMILDLKRGFGELVSKGKCKDLFIQKAKSF